MRPALDPALREDGLLLRPRFDEAQEEHARDGSGVAHASSIESMETRVEKTPIWSVLRPRFDEAEAGDVGELSSIKLAAARRCRARRRSLRRNSTAIAAVRTGRRRAA